MSEHFYRPADGHRLPHDPFNAIVAPRPIGWIGTVSPGGTPNLAPYSFFNGFCYTPPLVGFSSIGHKHSVANLERTREFSWNLVSRPLAEQMNTTSTMRDVDEFELAGLEAAECVEIGAPRVAGSPVSFECRVTQVIELLDTSGVGTGAWLTMGQVVGVHIDERYLVDGVYQTALAQPVMRAGGPSAYYGITEDQRFDLRRPQ